MIHVIQTIEGQEYRIRDAKFDEKTGLWIGEVLADNVRVGVSSRLVRIVFFFESEAAFDTYQRDHGSGVSKTRGGSKFVH